MRGVDKAHNRTPVRPDARTPTRQFPATFTGDDARQISQHRYAEQTLV